MASSETAMIDSVSKANRYLSGLGGKVGFSEAVRRVQANSSTAIAEKLTALERFVKGDQEVSPTPELALIGDVVRHAPDRTDAGSAINSANTSLSDARDLADHLRSGLPGDLGYAAVLLAVAGIVTGIWIAEIAPTFSELFSQMGADLPAISQLLINQPWIVVGGIAGLAALLVAVFVGARSLAARIETIAPLRVDWLGALLGDEVRRSYESWRMLTLARAWAAGGQQPVDAIVHAGRILNASPDVSSELESTMTLAAELEAAEAELDYQLRGSVEKFRIALEWRRAAALRFLQMATAVLVGVIVLALYLPIFKMGAIV